ncbi:MAG: polysaccharide pyruvyl transferase CsaB [Oscillospiraceae bacterium]|jgi:polysaccharide pyruvyl transferase CsaB|nr:polysaccharide pyruvyl transferase CsaB [Oscillospiraceae bacterium]
MAKILIAAMGLDIGGAETHIVELARALKRRGHEVAIASGGGVYARDIQAAGIPHHLAPMNARSPAKLAKSYFLLRRLIKKWRPDIVHAHARIPAFLCGLLQKTGRFRFVTTAHGVFKVDGVLRFLSNWGRKTIAVSEDIKRYLMENYGVPERDIFVTINGIDTEKFSPGVPPENVRRELGLAPGAPVICHVSRLDDAASLIARQLVTLAPRLARALPGVKILIAGGGDIFEELAEKARETNLAAGYGAVVMPGARTDIEEILAAGDVFVGVSRAALEALASGKPTVMAGNAGFLGLFEPSRQAAAAETNFTCRGCAASTEELLFDELLRCFRDCTPEYLAELSSFGVELVRRDYSVSRMTDDCERAYGAAASPRHRVVMSGYYGFGNAGDEAILQSIHRNIENCGGDVAIRVLSKNPRATKAQYGYDAVGRFNLPGVLRAISQSDALVFGGGSLLQDQTSTRSLLYYLFIIRLAKLLRKKVMIYANGIGPVKKPANRRRVADVVARADVITLRDEPSARELREMGVRRDDVAVTADPVFTMAAPARAETEALRAALGLPDAPFAVVSVRAQPGMGDFPAKMARLCDEIHDKLRLAVVFLPMQTPNDAAISREVSARMKKPSVVLDGAHTASELMALMSLAELVLAMRLHALIFAARSLAPCAGIVCDPKVEAYLGVLGMPAVGAVTDFDPDAALAALRDLSENRAARAAALETRVASQRDAAQSDARILWALLER